MEALREKELKANREREELKRLEAERRREEHLKEQRKAEARIEQFNTLVECWRDTQERRAFLVALREAVGLTDGDSELGRWLQWAEHYIKVSDPLERFKNRGQSLKLYFCGYQHEIKRIKAEGFEDPEPSEYDRNRTTPGVLLRDRPGESPTDARELEVTEDLVLPYEVTEPGYVPRTFYVPASVRNQHLTSRNAP
jgi:hypothetical protein